MIANEDVRIKPRFHTIGNGRRRSYPFRKQSLPFLRDLIENSQGRTNTRGCGSDLSTLMLNTLSLKVLIYHVFL